MMPLLTDPALQWTLHVSFAALFLVAALHKLRDRRRFVAALEGYAIVPARALPPLAGVLIALEIAIGAGLAGGVGGGLPALAGAALMLVYAAAIARALQRGHRDIDCGCGLAGVPRPIGVDLVLRNALLAALLVLASLPTAGRALQWLDGVTLLAGSTALALLYAAVERALAAARTAAAWRRPA